MLSVSVPEQSELTEYVPERARLGKRMPLSDPFSLVICVKLPRPRAYADQLLDGTRDVVGRTAWRGRGRTRAADANAI
jgi:hypothetical protein